MERGGRRFHGIDRPALRRGGERRRGPSAYGDPRVTVAVLQDRARAANGARPAEGATWPAVRALRHAMARCEPLPRPRRGAGMIAPARLRAAAGAPWSSASRWPTRRSRSSHPGRPASAGLRRPGRSYRSSAPRRRPGSSCRRCRRPRPSRPVLGRAGLRQRVPADRQHRVQRSGAGADHRPLPRPRRSPPRSCSSCATRSRAHYVEAGYVNSGALIPDQEVRDGVIEIQIVEGRLADVVVNGLTSLDPEFVGRADPARRRPAAQRQPAARADPAAPARPGDRPGQRAPRPGPAPRRGAARGRLVEAPRYQPTFRFANDRSPAVGAEHGELT